MAPEPDPHKNVDYEALSDFPGRTKRRKRWHWQWSLMSFGMGCGAALLIAGIFFGLAQTANRPMSDSQLEAQTWNECTESSREAKARGCVIDPALYAWVPPQCYYPELVASLNPILKDRKYYKDENMTQELTVQQLYDGENRWIYGFHYHDEHCLFQWRKLQFAIENKKELVDSWTLDYGHSKHCADAMTAGREPDKTVQKIGLAFYKCRKTPRAV
ncbi:hypothetical protein HJFPF1_13359 [Paramyrothecium foliicola]|nr:hypothetical protein HJFPF1_13359 [Paramyrothecium foliicola]